MSLFDTSSRPALEYLPSCHDLRSLKEAAAHCQGCDREDQYGRSFVIASLVADLKAASQYVSAQRPK
jgi:hypothetical protein